MSARWKNVATTDGVACVSKLAILNLAKTELGIGSTVPIDMRITRVDLWVPPAFQNSERNYVVFSPCDWTSRSDCDSSSQLNWYEAWGTSTQPAHVHYIWPRSISVQVMPANSDFEVFKLDTKKSAEYIMYVHMQWRNATPNPIQLAYGQLDSLRHTTQSSNDHEFDEEYVSVTQLTI